MKRYLQMLEESLGLAGGDHVMATTKKKFKESKPPESEERREMNTLKLSLPCPANKSHFCQFPRCPAAAQPSGFHRCRFDFPRLS
jgi:hypothetical protein